MRQIDVIVERGNDNRFSAYMDCYDLDFGLSGYGASAKEAIADFYESYDEEKILCAKEGKHCPELEFNIIYDVSSFLNYYSGILSKSGLQKVTGINQKQLWHYAVGSRRPKKNTVRKIQEQLHRFADDLRQVQFL